MPRIDSVLRQLGIVLPPPPAPVASYIPFVRTGNLVFISGQLPSRDGNVVYSGKVPRDVTLDHAKDAAKLCLLNALAILNDACGGNLDNVSRIVRLGVFVQSNDDFTQQPVVANGASDLLRAVFGEPGRHVRVAVGANALPLNAAVELELLVELAA